MRAKVSFEDSLAFAQQLDREDPLHRYREEFYIPTCDGGECIYFCGNSLGLQPRRARHYIDVLLEDWARMGVEGHFKSRHPWYSYHEMCIDSLARLVGARPEEVTVMNSLTVNLHLMLVSFYRPTPTKYKVLMEYKPFPSDVYAVASQMRYHGYDPGEGLLFARGDGRGYVPLEAWEQMLDEHGDTIALVLIGQVNYYSGQAFDLRAIVEQAHRYGCMVGVDLAHGIGNLPLTLHDDGVDFGVWCSYKYLNSGPGGPAGIFVHRRHLGQRELPRFEGWWGHNKDTRFAMPLEFDPLPTAEAWQLSNPPIAALALHRAALDLFDEVGMSALRQKSLELTDYLLFLLQRIDDGRLRVLTPTRADERGCQLSLSIAEVGKEVYRRLSAAGVVVDWREPDVVRVAPVPLYNTFEEVYRFANLLKEVLSAL